MAADNCTPIAADNWGFRAYCRDGTTSTKNNNGLSAVIGVTSAVIGVFKDSRS
jgi:hypothetical protein